VSGVGALTGAHQADHGNGVGQALEPSAGAKAHHYLRPRHRRLRGLGRGMRVITHDYEIYALKLLVASF